MLNSENNFGVYKACTAHELITFLEDCMRSMGDPDIFIMDKEGNKEYPLNIKNIRVDTADNAILL